MKTPRIEEILLNRVLFIGDNEWKLKGYPQELIDELTTALTQARREALDEVVEVLLTFKNEIPKTTRQPFELAENVGKQMVLDEVIKALQDNK